MPIPQVAQDYIKECVRKEMSGKETDMKWYIANMVNCWDMDGFASKREAGYAYDEFTIACRIRTYCRRNGRTTRKGSRHTFNGQTHDEPKMWEIVRSGPMEGEADGIKWTYRKIDQLRNIYVSF
jgi:hypothetical protein